MYYVSVDAEYILKKVGNIKTFISYCDVLPVDYYLTQRFNGFGIKTVTLQHAFFPNGSEAYLNSKSRLFIANSEISKKYAINSGLSNVCVGGPVAELEVDEREQMLKSGVFAVLLDDMHIDEKTRIDNNSMIDFSEKLANTFSLKFIIRYHPADRDNHFNRVLSGLSYISSVETETIDDLLKKVDFVVLNKSTCLFSAIMRLIS